MWRLGDESICRAIYPSVSVLSICERELVTGYGVQCRVFPCSEVSVTLMMGKRGTKPPTLPDLEFRTMRCLSVGCLSVSVPVSNVECRMSSLPSIAKERWQEEQ
jgi:hypothetical protein